MHFLLNGVVCIKTLKLCLILLFFRCFEVNFNLQKKSYEVNSVYFLPLKSLECLKLLYTFIQVRQLAPLLGLFSKNNTFGPRSRYRKKLQAAAANQIAGNKKISLGMHK